jgi:hypothetical protein
MPAMRQLLLDLFGAGSATEDIEPNRPPTRISQAPPATDSIVNGSAPALELRQALPPAAFSHPQANRHIVLGDAQVAYAFRRGRRRTIGLTVGAEGLSVSAPRWTPLAEVEALLRQKSRWVLDKLMQAREHSQAQTLARIDWREGAPVPYLGQPSRCGLTRASATARPARCSRAARYGWGCRKTPPPSACATPRRPG